MRVEGLSRGRAALRAGLILVLLLSPLPFGSVQPWSVLSLELGAAALGAGALLLILRDPEGLPRRARLFLIPSGVLLAVGLIQLLPMPAGWTALIAPETAAVRRLVESVASPRSASLNPTTLDPSATLDAVLRLAAYLLIGLSAVVAVRRRSHLVQITFAIGLAATFQALYGAAEYLSGRQHIFGFAKEYYTDSATGTFINRNHFAGYLAMALPLALGLALEAHHRDGPAARTWRERIVAWGRPAGLRAAAGVFAAAAIWAGVVLSYSRSGMAAALLACCLVVFRTPAWKRQARFLALVLVLPTAFLLWQEIRAPGERFVAEQAELTSLAGRLPVWRAALRMVPDYPVLGTGLGTFEGAFALYRPSEVRKAWSHAHNDWLQSLTEGGVPVFAAMIAVLVLALARRGRDAASFTTLAPVHAALLAIAVQSAIDFSLRIPANAALCACLIGLTCIRENNVDPSVVELPLSRGHRRFRS